MKLSEIQHLPETIQLLFTHFKKFKIESNWSIIDNYDELYKIIVNSKLKSHNYLSNIHEFTIDFALPDNIQEIDATYYFNFTDIGGVSDNSLLIDLNSKSNISFMKFEFSFEQFPPFILGLRDKMGRINTSEIRKDDYMVKVNENKILTMDEFELYLGDQIINREIIMIEVD